MIWIKQCSLVGHDYDTVQNIRFQYETRKKLFVNTVRQNRGIQRHARLYSA